MKYEINEHFCTNFHWFFFSWITWIFYLRVNFLHVITYLHLGFCIGAKLLCPYIRKPVHLKMDRKYQQKIWFQEKRVYFQWKKSIFGEKCVFRVISAYLGKKMLIKWKKVKFSGNKQQYFIRKSIFFVKIKHILIRMISFFCLLVLFVVVVVF